MKYSYYIGLEFGYRNPVSDEAITLYLTDIVKRDSDFNYDTCTHCGKALKKVIYTFTRTDSGQFEEYLFGSECVKQVFQAGLGIYSKIL